MPPIPAQYRRLTDQAREHIDMPSTPPSADAAAADPPSPPSPTASFYDMSDDEETEYRAVGHSHTRKGVKLLYAKCKVYVHPSPSAKDNVAGYIALMQQKPGEAEPPTSPEI